MDIGKKQLALLLLLYIYPGITVNQTMDLLNTGIYKTIQAALNKLVGKGLLKTVKRSNKLYYFLTENGVDDISSLVLRLCVKCKSLEVIRELYR